MPLFLFKKHSIHNTHNPSRIIVNFICLKKLIFLLLLQFYCLLCVAQKVGLVLSGGGAKGLAHIGVLKALEENHIPID